MPTVTTSRRVFWLSPLRMKLRTLMILVPVVGVGLAWDVGRRQREARRQWVIATIKSSGSSVEFAGPEISRITWFGGSTSPASLPQRELTPDQIEALGACDQLRALMMVSGAMTDAALDQVSHDSLLEHLYCFQPRITDAGVKHLARLKHLKSLQLLRVPDLTDAALGLFAGLAELEALTLSASSIQGTGFDQLIHLKKLNMLVTANSPITDTGLASIGRLTSLTNLWIGGGDYSDAGVANLAHLSELQTLGLGSSHCTAACLDHLASLRKLETLALSGRQINDAWIDELAHLKQLHAIQIDGAQVSDEALDRLHAALPAVQLQYNGRPR